MKNIINVVYPKYKMPKYINYISPQIRLLHYYLFPNLNTLFLYKDIENSMKPPFSGFMFASFTKWEKYEIN